jgi:ATP-binding cassette, subfamily F, member 3
VKLLLDPPNLLLMDEPTTHLDLSSVDALAYALDQFEGTLVFISHDVYFIRALANHVVHVNAGRLTHYPGGYQYYLDKTKAQSERAGLTATGGGDPSGRASVRASPNSRGGSGNQGSRGRSPSRAADLGESVEGVPASSRKEQKRLEAEQRQARSRERKARHQIVHRLEKEIQELEARQSALVAELEQPGTYEQPGRAMEVNRDLLEVQRRLAELNPQWEREATRLAALDDAN